MVHSQLLDRVEITKRLSERGYYYPRECRRLHQVFLNVITNASQAIEDVGNITISTSIS